jgi:predicted nucleic-acid-binding protein
VIGLDANVVVRYLVQDDPRQSAAATRIFEKSLSPENPGFITLVTLAEIGWVLAECYAANRERIHAVVEGLLSSRQIAVEQPDVAWKALRAWKGATADLGDSLILQVALAAGSEKVLTFDKAASKMPGFELIG